MYNFKKMEGKNIGYNGPSQLFFKKTVKVDAL